MSARWSWMGRIAGACVLLAAAGCGARPVPVKGAVYFDGKPLANAMVMFHAQEAGGLPAVGQTDAGGVFELTTSRLKDGAMPGSYRVTILYSDPVKTAPGSPDNAQQAALEAASRKPTIVIPAIFTRPDQTPLKHNIPDDGDAKFELHTSPQ